MNKTLLLSAMLLAILMSQTTHALKEERLWLPKKYRTLMPELIRVAKLQESTERCLEVVKAKFDESTAKSAEHQFRIDCRDRQGITYSSFVTEKGLLASVLTSTAVKSDVAEDVWEGSEDQEISEATAINADELNIADMWSQCAKRFKDKKSRFKSAVLDLGAGPWYRLGDLGTVSFYVAMDAKNHQDKNLEYVVMCDISEGLAPTVMFLPSSSISTDEWPVDRLSLNSAASPIKAGVAEEEDEWPEDEDEVEWSEGKSSDGSQAGLTSKRQALEPLDFGDSANSDAKAQDPKPTIAEPLETEFESDEWIEE